MGGARDTRMVGDNIVARSPGSPLWSRWRPNPVHQNSQILGQVQIYSPQEIMFTLSVVDQKYLWEGVSEVLLENVEQCTCVFILYPT